MFVVGVTSVEWPCKCASCCSDVVIQNGYKIGIYLFDVVIHLQLNMACSENAYITERHLLLMHYCSWFV